MSAVKQYLHQLGYTDKEIELFLAVYQYGPKPVSTIAKLSNTERTYCYKLLQKLLADDLIQQTTEKNTKLFFVANDDILINRLHSQIHQLQMIEDSYEEVKQELALLRLNQQTRTPKIAIFDGQDSLKRVFQDILMTTQQKELLAITMFIPQTFATIAQQQPKYQQAFQWFLEQIENVGLTINGVLWQGVLLMEQLIATNEFDQLRALSIGIDTTQWFLVGDTLYMIQYKQLPLAVKITSPDLAEMLRFLFEIKTSTQKTQDATP